ncbi:MAG: LTA synthase family protein [Eubacteriales bacterium]|nr:LTA synthase family protein [Eubacteriales bacterium]
MRKKLPKFPIPGWLAAVVTAVLCEGLLHLWTAEALLPARFLTVLVLALGFGCLLGQVVSFLGRGAWGKAVTVVLLVAVAACYLVSFFVWQFFQTFMSPITILRGAGGVATGFAGDALTLVVRGLWRIALMLLPALSYALLARPVRTQWRTRWLTLVLALAAYGLGFTMVQARPADAARLGETYQYESAVNAFGLHVAAVLDLGGGQQQEDPGPLLPPAPPAEPTEAETTPPSGETEPAVIDYGENKLYDFDALAAAESNSLIAQIHQGVGAVEPTKKNEYTGLFQGKNLIFITAEAFAKEVIDPELTPTLYRLANQGVRFDDFYQPKWGAGTTSGEFSNLVGLVPTNGGSCMLEAHQQDLFLTMGKQLQKQGYSSAAYHNNDYKYYDRNKNHPFLGYDYFMGYGNGMEEGVTGVWPQSDLEMIDFTIPKHLDHTPFNLYYMSVSGHSTYSQKTNAMARKNYDEVAAFCEKTGKTWSEPLKCYMAANLELEKAMASMVRQLEEAGILEDTVIVISPDHFPYGLENTKSPSGQGNCLDELYGYKSTNSMEHEHNALILWSPCLEGRDIVVSEPTYSLDILPTLLNLFGLDYDSRLLVGRDVFSGAEPLVLWPNFSWKTDLGYFNASTGEFLPTDGAPAATQDYISWVSQLVQYKIRYSSQVLDRDYFNYLSAAVNESQ